MLTLLLIKKCLWHFFVILRIHKASLGSCEVPQKFGYDRFSSYGVYRLQTSKVYIYIFVDIYLYSPWSTYIWSTKRRSALLKILDIKSISTMCRYPTRFFSLSSTFIPLDIYQYPLQTRYGWNGTGLLTKDETSETTVQNLYCVLTYI